MKRIPAPPLLTKEWLNTDQQLSLDDLRGKVILIEAFQMLCPGCVSHGLPQAARVAQAFSSDDVAVVGLHTVFEHHAAQGNKAALEAFLHEYKITFPIAMDAPCKTGGVPQTMAAYQMQGTPTLILIDRAGFLRKKKFGMEQDLILGAELMALVKEGAAVTSTEQTPTAQACDDDGCPAPKP